MDPLFDTARTIGLWFAFKLVRLKDYISRNRKRARDSSPISSLSSDDDDDEMYSMVRMTVCSVVQIAIEASHDESSKNFFYDA